jgi:hypothetical protein
VYRCEPADTTFDRGTGQRDRKVQRTGEQVLETWVVRVFLCVLVTRSCDAACESGERGNVGTIRSGLKVRRSMELPSLLGFSKLPPILPSGGIPHLIGGADCTGMDVKEKQKLAEDSGRSSKASKTTSMFVLLDTYICNNFTRQNKRLRHQGQGSTLIKYQFIYAGVEETAIEFTTDRTGADDLWWLLVAFHVDRSNAFLSSFAPHVSLSFFLLCPIRWRHTCLFGLLDK